jgi:hypothetical protein
MIGQTNSDYRIVEKLGGSAKMLPERAFAYAKLQNIER